MAFKIPVSSPIVDEEDKAEVLGCLNSGWISSSGQYVRNFESSFSSFVGTKYGVATNSGTTSLHLALASLNLKPRDEIVIPTFTMIASANAAEYLRLKITLVDADPKIWTMDLDDLIGKITNKTKAIMPVHIYGHPEDMKVIKEIASDRDLYIIEDAAEAHGAEAYGKKVGGTGDIGSFSFYANKIITTGEGGMAVTNDENLADRMAWLRSHAFGRGGKHFWHEELGYGYRMSALQAALGVSQVRKLEKLIQKRRRNAKLYNEAFSKLVEHGLVELPPEEPWAKNVYWMYSILVNSKSRDKLMAFLSNRGIETRTFFYPIHKQPYYSKRFKKGGFRNAEKISSRGLNLPSGNTLTEEDITTVVEQINHFFKDYR